MFSDLVFPSHSRVLDIGCGFGQRAASIAAQVKGSYVVGVDSDAPAVNSSTAYFPPSKHSNLRFLQSDARTLDFLDEPFDAAISVGCLHYLDHPGEAFQAIARHLKPGGRLCVACLGEGNLTDVHIAIQATMKMPAWQSYFQDFQLGRGSLADPASCDPWLDKAGLQKKQAQLANDPLYFSQRQDFVNWVAGNFSHCFGRVPRVHQRAFATDFVDQYCGEGYTGNITARRVWLQLEAYKSA